MKNLAKIRTMLKLVVVCMFLFNTAVLKAQSCGMTVINNLPCDVSFDVIFYENLPPCTACLGSPVNITVLANGGSTNLNCTGLWSCSPNICDISITFTSPFTAGPFLYSNGTQQISAATCVNPPSSNIVFSGNTITFNP